MTGRILVVDDVEQNVRLLEAKLNNEYYTVYTAYNGAEALDKIKTVSPDVVLLDVMMPEMDGFEVCRRIKANPDIAHIPVVMVTALSSISDRVQGLEAGASDFITKPIDELHLMARVRSLIRIKLMLDELRMRDKTGAQFGLKAKQALDHNHEPLGTLIVIDDDIVQAQKVQNVLSQRGHRVDVVSPEVAIQSVNDKHYDLAILNTLLDEADGLRLGMHILSQEENRHLPIIIMVDEDDRKLVVKGLDIGIDDYILTPLDSNELIARVRTQLRRRQYQDALKATYEESLSAAVMDSLTKLYNRRYLDAHLANMAIEALNKGTDLSLLTLDIDHFKQVNDHPGWGHHIGDEVLCAIARQIVADTRSTDLATRSGGEEFVVVMPKAKNSVAELVADRIRRNIESKPVKISADPGFVRVTISIGIATLRHDGSENPQTLMKRSDEALYEAKRNGRNRFVNAEEGHDNYLMKTKTEGSSENW